MKKTIFSILLILLTQNSYALENKDISISEEITSKSKIDNLDNQLKNFSKELSEKEENYLRNKLKRNNIGFNLTYKREGDLVKFEVPDYINRETIYNLNYAIKSNSFSGKILEEEELFLLNPLIKKYFKDIKTNNLSIFPYKENQGKNYAVSNIAISDLYVKPIAVAGDNLATQTRLGTPFKILEASKDKKFFRVLSEDDNYIAWIKGEDLIFLKDQADYENYSESRIYITTSDIKNPLIYSGTILKGQRNDNKIKLTLPNKNTVIVDSSNAIKLSDLTKNKDKVIQNAQKRLDLGLKGKTNYLWGGSVTQDIDCSGFNQSIFRLEGILLPRDADQQQEFTKPVAKTLNEINELKKGDLLFFSGNRKYATHTGIYIGDYKFIHSSPKGQYRGIKINTLKGGGEYDKFLQKIYFGGGRLYIK